jgi:acetyl-CoA acetyltransferase
VGHPFGASGTRYLLTLALSMRQHHARYGVLGVCAGSGQGVAILLENDQA